MNENRIINIRIIFLLLFVIVLHKCSGHNVSAEEAFMPVVNENYRTGYANMQGKVVIGYEFLDATLFSEGLAAVRDEKFNLKVGYIDTEGKYIISPKFETGGAFHQGYAVVMSTPGRLVLIDKTGTMIGDRESYSRAKPFSGNYAAVCKENLCGYLGLNGEYAIPLTYEYAGSFSEGLAPVRLHGKFGYINTEGTFAIAARFKWAGEFSEGLAAVRLDGLFGFIDHKGKVVIAPRFAWVEPFSDGLALVRKNNHYFYINRIGAPVISPGTIDYAEQQTKGAASCAYNKNSASIPPISVHSEDEIDSFSEGLARIKHGGCWGYINKKGHIVIGLQYEQAEPFKNSVAYVERNGYALYIDNHGHQIWRSPAR